MVVAIPTSSPHLNNLLDRHPRVSFMAGDAPAGELVFFQGSWQRRITWNRPASPSDLSGLVELCDNNPMVCTDTFVWPTPGALLALIALGPLVRAGLVVEDPVLKFSEAVDADDIRHHLAREGWNGDCLVIENQEDLGGLVALTAMVVVPTLDDLGEFDGLFEEAFGRSFTVRLSDSPLDPAMVLGTGKAFARLLITPDEPHSLLSIHVMAEREGKLGPEGIIHAMNVMAGFEETLGLSGGH